MTEIRPEKPRERRDERRDQPGAVVPTGRPEVDLAAFEAVCQLATTGFVFHLTGDGYDEARTISGAEAAYVGWAELAAGAYTVQEEIPADYGDPIVFCEGQVPGIQYVRRNLFQLPAAGGAVAYHLSENESLYCDWFNMAVAAERGEGGEGEEADGGDPGADGDGDGLSDADELGIHGTDPANADTDFDGLPDGDEIWAYGSSPLTDDTDADWLPDYNEVAQHGTDPSNPDTDGDGASDHDELNAGTDPLAADAVAAAADSDGDGVADDDELNVYGTDPALTDTDGDGLLDGDEVFTSASDPISFDTDLDGLSDGEEVATFGTNPTSPDSDGDGYLDGDEVVNGTDPFDPASF